MKLNFKIPRCHFFEWEDLPWFPHFIRQYMMDILTFILCQLNLYQLIIPKLHLLLQTQKEDTILDLCSGSGGGILPLVEKMNTRPLVNITFILSDKYPHCACYRQLKKDAPSFIEYISEPIDIMSPRFSNHCQTNFPDVETIFSAFHHFTENQARHILGTMVQSRKAIGIFEGASRSWSYLLAAICLLLPTILLITPFIYPFSFKRIVFTYFIPIVPFCTIWDGIISIFRIYKPSELLSMAQSVSPSSYTWEAGILKHRWGFHVTYLIGYPNQLL